MGTDKWTNIPLPVVLVKKIEEIKDVAGYSSVSEFVREAVRVRLRELNQEDAENED